MKPLRIQPVPAPESVPFIDLKRSLAGKQDVIVDAWRKILGDTEFVGGKSVQKLEKELAAKLSVREALACANGTDALILALQACGVMRGSKVAVPNLTFWATYEAVVQVGATPVLIDISPDDLQLDLDEVMKAHAKFGLDAVLVAHLYGWTSSRLQELRSFCKSARIRLIEDGAQSFGVLYKGKSIYADADIATLSFYPAKVFGGAMDGGAVLSSDPELITLCRTLANHGRSSHYSYSHVGWNSRMGGLQATFLLEMLKEVDRGLQSRRDALKIYEDAFRHSPVKLWTAPEECLGNGYLATITCDDLDGEELSTRLKAVGVFCGRVYPEGLGDQPCVPKDVPRVSDMRHSRDFARKVVNLPLFAFITEEECRFVVDRLLNVVLKR